MALKMKATVPWLVRLVCLVPFSLLLFGIYRNSLGPDPADALATATGEWALRFLLLSLSITPIRKVFGWSDIAPLRRTFGLFALFYATAHFLVYIVFLLQFRWSEIFEDVIERPYITVGFVAFCILLLLGITSPKWVVKRLGRKWKLLHTAVYPASILAIIHLFWILRTDVAEAAFYAMILLPILGYRVFLYSGSKR
jgi:sulfoxide reductase heme-binding subunit YedZ